MEIFDELLEKWMEEFGRAVEMFTGEKPVLRSSEQGSELSGSEIAGRTWWKQIVENGEAFSIWAGSTEGLWNAFGEGAEAQTTYFEMLSQANQGTAAVLSAGFQFPLRCQDGSVEAPVLTVPLECAKIKIRFRDSDAGDIFLVVDKSALAILSPEEPAAMQETGDRESPAVPGENSSMLSRLLDLRLPVSILLGRTKITIKEALKLMPGSVIELDRQVGDYVEIMVHGTVVAKGEIVSVEGNYGVRIKEVISRQDRMALHEAA
jgi:flagellar motor switch protein FliN/FliY